MAFTYVELKKMVEELNKSKLGKQIALKDFPKDEVDNLWDAFCDEVEAIDEAGKTAKLKKAAPKVKTFYETEVAALNAADDDGEDEEDEEETKKKPKRRRLRKQKRQKQIPWRDWIDGA